MFKANVSRDGIFVETEVFTANAAELDKQVQKDLSVPDPEEGEANDKEEG